MDATPLALAENSGLSPIETLADIKSRQINENNSQLGIDCMGTGSNGNNLIVLFLLKKMLLIFFFFRYESSICLWSTYFQKATILVGDSTRKNDT